MTNRNHSRRGFGSSYYGDEERTRNSNRPNRQGYGRQEDNYEDEFEGTSDAYYDDDMDDRFMNTGGYGNRGRFEDRSYENTGYDNFNDDEDVDEQSFRRGREGREENEGGYYSSRNRGGDESGYYRTGNSGQPQRPSYGNRYGSSQGRPYRVNDPYQQEQGRFRQDRGNMYSERGRGSQGYSSQSGSYGNMNDYGSSGQGNRRSNRSQNTGRGSYGSSNRRNDQGNW